MGPLLEDGGPIINPALPNGSGAGEAASYSLNADGTYTITGAAAGSWLLPPSDALADLYEVKVDETSGSFDSGTVGSYLALTATRGWTKSNVGTVTFTITFRLASSGTVVSTQTGKTVTVS